jgi:hypothetical protein
VTAPPSHLPWAAVATLPLSFGLQRPLQQRGALELVGGRRIRASSARLEEIVFWYNLGVHKNLTTRQLSEALVCGCTGDTGIEVAM